MYKISSRALRYDLTLLNHVYKSIIYELLRATAAKVAFIIADLL
jgi:hypothetical protein